MIARRQESRERVTEVFPRQGSKCDGEEKQRTPLKSEHRVNETKGRWTRMLVLGYRRPYAKHIRVYAFLFH